MFTAFFAAVILWWSEGNGPSPKAKSAIEKIVQLPSRLWRVLTCGSGKEAVRGMSSMQRDAQLTKGELNALRACNESGEDVLAAYGIVINTVYDRILIFFNSGTRCDATRSSVSSHKRLGKTIGAERFLRAEMPFALADLRKQRGGTPAADEAVSSSAASAVAAVASAAEGRYIASLAESDLHDAWKTYRKQVHASSRRKSNLTVTEEQCATMGIKLHAVEKNLGLFYDDGDLIMPSLEEQEKAIPSALLHSTLDNVGPRQLAAAKKTLESFASSPSPAATIALHTHEGIYCDSCADRSTELYEGYGNIVGQRYNRGEIDYCQPCFNDLSVDEREDFVLVEPSAEEAQYPTSHSLSIVSNGIAAGASMTPSVDELLPAPFRVSTGAKLKRTVGELTKWVHNVETRLRCQRLLLIQYHGAVFDNGSARLMPLLALITMLGFFAGANKRLMEQMSWLRFGGGYWWATCITGTIAVLYSSIVLINYLQFFSPMMRQKFRKRVQLMIGDNFVKLSTNSYKKAGESLVHSAVTIMFAHLWITNTPGGVDYAELDVDPDPACPLNKGIDDAAVKSLLDLLEREDVKKLRNGSCNPYIQLITEDDINRQRDTGRDPSTRDYYPNNVPGSFGTHATFFALVLAATLSAIAFGVGEPILIFLADQEGAWVWEKLSAGLVASKPALVAGVSVATAAEVVQSLAHVILSYAGFHSRKNLTETIVYDDLNMSQFWSPFLGTVMNEYKFRDDKVLPPRDKLRKCADILSLKKFILGDTYTAAEKAELNRLPNKDALINHAFALGVRATGRKTYVYRVVSSSGDGSGESSDNDGEVSTDSDEGEDAAVPPDIVNMLSSAEGTNGDGDDAELSPIQSQKQAVSAMNNEELEECISRIKDCLTLIDAADEDTEIADTNASDLGDLIATFETFECADTDEVTSARAMLATLIPEDDDDDDDDDDDEEEEGSSSSDDDDSSSEVGSDDESDNESDDESGEEEEEEEEEGSSKDDADPDDAMETSGGDADDDAGAARDAPATTKDRKSMSIGYTRLDFDVTLVHFAWNIFFRYVCLYFLSQQVGFAADVGFRVSESWDDSFVASIDQLLRDDPTEPFTATYTPPSVPFDIDLAVAWGIEQHPGFAFHWRHLDVEVRLCIEPFDELMTKGNVLPLYNSFVSRACLFIYAQRSKVARVDLCYLWRLLYWLTVFPLVVLPFLARHCKRIYQDVIIEYLNRVVSGMCRRDRVEPSYVAKMTCCIRQRHKLVDILAGVTGRGGRGERKPSLTSLREMRWSSRFEDTRIQIDVYFAQLCKEMFGERCAHFGSVNRIADVLNDNLVHSKRDPSVAWGWTQAVNDLSAALRPKAARAARSSDGVANMNVKQIKAELKLAKIELTHSNVRPGDEWKSKWKLTGVKADLVVRLKVVRIAVATHRRHLGSGVSRAGRVRHAATKYGS